MAILKKGIYSEISGTLGDFVYSSRKGRTVVSTKPDPLAPKKPATVAQQAQREKFKLIFTMDLANVGRQQAEFEVCSGYGCRVHVYVFTLGQSKGGNSESQYLGLVA